MPYFFFLHVKCSKAFDARCVDNVAVTRHGKHLGKSSGVHAFVVIGGDCAGFDIQFRKDGIDKGGFTYSGMSGEERYFPFEFFFYSVDSLTGFGGYLETRVTDGSIKIDKSVQVAKLVFVVSVCFIEDDIDGYAVCLGRCQKTIDECSGGFRIIHRYHQHTLVEVGGKDVRLFGQVGRTPDNIVLSVFNFVDERCSFLIQYDLHMVAYCHRIGATDTF